MAKARAAKKFKKPQGSIEFRKRSENHRKQIMLSGHPSLKKGCK